MEIKKTAEEIRKEIATNEDVANDAFANLQMLIMKAGPRSGEYFTQLVRACNLCSYVCRDRAKLEFELTEALRDGR